jgi:nitrilase
MKIAALQLATLPLSNQKLKEYLESCYKKGIDLVVLGEYVLNSFFKELESIPRMLIKEQSKHKIESLTEYANYYKMTIIAPVVTVEEGKLYKKIGKFSPEGVTYRDQEFLINYSHWDEESFFDNEPKGEIEPIIFSMHGLNFGVISGFEVHFDIFWQKMMSKNVDVVLLPTVSTFGSNFRWNELLKSRAFLNNVYILRVNRIGTYHDENSLWKFYGETYLVNPDGHIESSLSNKEDMLIAKIDKKELKEAKRNWGFRDQLKSRGLL